MGRHAIEIIYPAYLYRVMSSLLKEFDENNYYPALRLNDEPYAFFASGMISDSTLTDLISFFFDDPNGGKINAFEVQKPSNKIVRQLSNSLQSRVFFDRKIAIRELGLTEGVPRVDTMESALELVTQDGKYIPPMRGSISILSKELVD